MHANNSRIARWLVAVVALGVVVPVAGAQQATATQKIANAESAGPQALVTQATILDWPAQEGAESTVLRAGTNGWVCYPDYPGTEGNDPMCLDKTWQAFMGAYMTQGEPNVTTVGVSYMLAPGGSSGSNTDPYATGPTADNEWGHDGPHLMVLAPKAALAALPTKRQEGAPYVMWAGTPYAHIMMPVGAARH